MSHELDDYFDGLQAELSKTEQATDKAHDNYLEKTFDAVAPVARKIHREQMRNSKRKPTRFNPKKEFERIMKVMLDIPEDFDVWVKKDDDLAGDEYRRRIQNIIWKGALMGTLYLTGRTAGISKPDIGMERVSMFLINHAMGNPPQRIAVADISTAVQDHFKELAEAVDRSKDNGGEDD